MGMRNTLGKSMRWVALATFAMATFSAHAVAAPPPTQSSDGCSTPSSSKPCSFDSAGTKNITSGGSSYGGSFFNGFGPNSNGGNGGTTTGSTGIQRFALTGETGKAAAGAGSKWNAWVSLSQNDIAYKYQPLQSSGHVTVALVGIDYTFANNVTLGVAGGWDQGRIGTTYNGGNLNSTGNMVAPYLSWRINSSWSLDAALGFGRAKYTQVDNSVAGGLYANYSDKRSIASLTAAYTKMMGKWVLTGRGGYLTSEDKYDQFTVSNGTVIAATTNRTSQIRIGGQAMYNAGSILPYAGLYYFNDVQRQSQAAVGGTTPANDRDGFQLQAGVQFAPRGSPIYGGILLSTDVGRSQVKNDMILGNIGIRF